MVYCAYPDKELVFKKKLSDQIIDLMKFFTGRTFLFKKDLTCNDDWNKLIWDLIRISGVSTYNHRSIREELVNQEESYMEMVHCFMS